MQIFMTAFCRTSAIVLVSKIKPHNAFIPGYFIDENLLGNDSKPFINTCVCQAPLQNSAALGPHLNALDILYFER